MFKLSDFLLSREESIYQHTYKYKSMHILYSGHMCVISPSITFYSIFNPTVNCILYRKHLTRVFSKTHKKRIKPFYHLSIIIIDTKKIIIPFFRKFFIFFAKKMIPAPPGITFYKSVILIILCFCTKFNTNNFLYRNF